MKFIKPIFYLAFLAFVVWFAIDLKLGIIGIGMLIILIVMWVGTALCFQDTIIPYIEESRKERKEKEEELRALREDNTRS